MTTKLKKLNNMRFIGSCRPKPGSCVWAVPGADRLEYGSVQTCFWVVLAGSTLFYVVSCFRLLFLDRAYAGPKETYHIFSTTYHTAALQL